MDEAELKMAQAKKPKSATALIHHHYKKDLKALETHAAKVKKQVDSEAVLMKKHMKAHYQKALKAYKKTKKNIIIKKDKTKSLIQKHPFLTVAAAATAGALLAKLLSRRR